MNRYSSLYTILSMIFIIFLCTMFFLNAVKPDKVFSESENRMLQQAPKFTLKNLSKGKFTLDFEKYITDQIALRDFWIEIKATSERLIGKKDNNDVYLGKDGYLLQKFEKSHGEKYKANLEAINTFTQSHPDLKVYFMLVPNSVKILEEKLPLFASPEDQKGYLDEAKQSLKDKMQFIDIFNTLSSHKDEYIYYKTDHHWTTKGAYYSYKKFMQDIGVAPHEESYFDIRPVTHDFYGSLYSKSGFRGLKPDSIKLYTPKQDENISVYYFDNNEYKSSLYEREHIEKKDKYNVFLGGNHSLIKIETNSDKRKKLLIVKDSFANSFIPFLTGHYGEIYIVDLRYYSDSLKELIDSNDIKEVLILYSVDTFAKDESIKYISW